MVRRKRPGDNMAMDKDDGRIDNGEEKEGSGGASRAGGSGRRWEGQVGRRDGLSWGGDGDGVGRRDDGGQVGGDVKTKLGTQGQRQHNMVSAGGCVYVCMMAHVLVRMGCPIRWEGMIREAERWILAAAEEKEGVSLKVRGMGVVRGGEGGWWKGGEGKMGRGGGGGGGWGC